MKHEIYRGLVNAELSRLHLAPVNSTLPRPIELPSQPPLAKLLLDLLSLFLVLVLPVFYAQSFSTFLSMSALLVVSLAVAHWPAVTSWLVSLWPDDRPRVTAVLQAPERLFCPRCGAEKTQDYCSGCGAHVEKEYRKIARRLVRYVVEDTEQQRAYLEAELQRQLRHITEQHKKAIEDTLVSMEERYVKEIMAQRQEIAALRQQLTQRGWRG